MFGTYCIFCLEPNNTFDFGIVKMSWLICKIADCSISVLLTNDYFVKQDDPKFKNYNYKKHGISNQILKLQGESVNYILGEFSDSLKNMNVDYICGFGINKHQQFIFDFAKKYNINHLKKEVLERKFIFIDIKTIIGQYINKNNIPINDTQLDIFKHIFNKDIPKYKFHNTSIDCQITKDILGHLVVNEVDLFDYIIPLLNDKVDLTKLDELQGLIDLQLQDENNKLIQKNIILEKRILQLEIDIQKKDIYISNQNDLLLQKMEKYQELYDNKIKLECKTEAYEELIKELNINFNLEKEKFANHEIISKQVINKLKDKISELDKPIEKLIDEHLETEYKNYDINDKECFICGNTVSNMCEDCNKYFCDIHVTDINDGFNTVACDKCFQKVSDNFEQYKLKHDIVVSEVS